MVKTINLNFLNFNKQNSNLIGYEIFKFLVEQMEDTYPLPYKIHRCHYCFYGLFYITIATVCATTKPETFFLKTFNRKIERPYWKFQHGKMRVKLISLAFIHSLQSYISLMKCFEQCNQGNKR